MAGTLLIVFCGYGHHITSRSLGIIYHIIFWVNRYGETPLQAFRIWMLFVLMVLWVLFIGRCVVLRSRILRFFGLVIEYSFTRWLFTWIFIICMHYVRFLAYSHANIFPSPAGSKMVVKERSRCRWD